MAAQTSATVAMRDAAAASNTPGVDEPLHLTLQPPTWLLRRLERECQISHAGALTIALLAGLFATEGDR